MSDKGGASNRSAKVGRVPALGNAAARKVAPPPKDYNAIFKAALNRTTQRAYAEKKRQQEIRNAKFAGEVRANAQHDARAEAATKAQAARPQQKRKGPPTPQGRPTGGFTPPKT